MLAQPTAQGSLLEPQLSVAYTVYCSPRTTRPAILSKYSHPRPRLPREPHRLLLLLALPMIERIPRAVHRLLLLLRGLLLAKSRRRELPLLRLHMLPLKERIHARVSLHRRLHELLVREERRGLWLR